MASQGIRLNDLKFLQEHAGRLFVAGGAVRDLILGRGVTDIDIVVPRDLAHLPRDFASSVRGRHLLLHDDRGQVTERVVVRAGEGPLFYDFSRMQGASIGEDLSLRDFTINAMALPLPDFLGGVTDALVDPLGGRGDLRSRRIRALSETSFADDPLRLLRAFRFAAELGFGIEPRTRRWIGRHRRLLAGVAGERIRDELFRTLSILPCRPFVLEMDRVGLLEVALPGVTVLKEGDEGVMCGAGSWNRSLARLHALEDLMGEPARFFGEFRGELRNYLESRISGERSRGALIKLAALHFDGDPGDPPSRRKTAGRLAGRLRLSRKEALFLGEISSPGEALQVLSAGPPPEREDTARFFMRHAENYFALILLGLAEAGRGASRFAGIVERAGRMLDLYDREIRPAMAAPPFLRGEELMERFGLDPGPEVGRILAALREAQVEGRVRSRDEALRFAAGRIHKAL